MGIMGGEGNHLIADISNGACMKSQGMGIIRFCGIFWKSDGSGRGAGKGRGKLVYLYRVKVSGGRGRT